LEVEVYALDCIAHRSGDDVATTFRRTAVELKNAIDHIHVVDTSIESERNATLVGPECTVGGAVAIGRERTCGGIHINGAAHGPRGAAPPQR